MPTESTLVLLDTEAEVIEASANGSENGARFWRYADFSVRIDGLSLEQARGFGAQLFRRVRIRIEAID